MRTAHPERWTMTRRQLSWFTQRQVSVVYRGAPCGPPTLAQAPADRSPLAHVSEPSSACHSDHVRVLQVDPSADPELAWTLLGIQHAAYAVEAALIDDG